jgi:hypothetical protein
VYDTIYDGTQDVFIAKLSADLNTLQASTFLGGSRGDHGAALALDSSGQVVVTGRTNSSDFPTTPGAYDTKYNDGLLDAFVAKLSADLSTLLAATFLGGSNGNDRGWSLAIDSSGQVVVTGLTNSSDFPTTPSAYDPSYNGGDGDIFIAKFSANLNTLLASTFLGGSNAECCSDPSLALDSSGQVAVTGETNSSDFPTTVDAYDTTYNGRQDIFITKLSADLGTLRASTFLGGSDGDYGMSLAFNSIGQVMVIGNTFSSDFPTTPNAYDTNYGGIGDIFIATLNADLSILQVSTFLGGSDWDCGFRGAFLSPESNRQVVVVGSTFSSDFPTTPGAYNTTYENGDAFIVKIDLEPETVPTPLPTVIPTEPSNSVPEPASVVLIGLSLLALFILGRKSWKR